MSNPWKKHRGMKARINAVLRAHAREMKRVSISCPVCNAPIGEPCRAAVGTFSKERGGQPLTRIHTERRKAIEAR